MKNDSANKLGIKLQFFYIENRAPFDATSFNWNDFLIDIYNDKAVDLVIRGKHPIRGGGGGGYSWENSNNAFINYTKNVPNYN